MSMTIKCPKCTSDNIKLEKTTGNRRKFLCQNANCKVEYFSVNIQQSILSYKESTPSDNEAHFDVLYESINRGKCIILLGPGLFTDQSANRFEENFSNHLKAKAKQLKINVYENGWFHFLPYANQSLTYNHIRNFYKKNNNGDFSKQILNKLSLIPFHLYISLSPDKKLVNSFEKYPHQYTYYHKMKTSIENQEEEQDENPFIKSPTAKNPLIYNMLGDLNENNSLVLTYDDFYVYLNSVLKGKGMDNELKADHIFGAENFIFLGVSFDMWYIHLFMRILEQHRDLKGIGKYVANTTYNATIAEACNEQYTMEFITETNAIENFLDGLLKFYRIKDQELLADCKESQIGLRGIDFALLDLLVQKEDYSAVINYLLVQLNKQGDLGRSHFQRAQYFQAKLLADNYDSEQSPPIRALQDEINAFIHHLQISLNNNTDDCFFEQ